MNSKMVLKNFSNACFIIEKNMFDYQVFRIIKWPHRQPDLAAVVRLFLNSIPSWLIRLADSHKYFRIYSLARNEAVLGSNNKNFEIRLYFNRCEELSKRIFLCFAIYPLNGIGYLQSIYLRMVFLIILQLSLKSMTQNASTCD
jgi:hypothetical protein